MARKKEERERKIKHSELIRTKHKELKQISPSSFVLIGSVIVIILILFLFRTEKTEYREIPYECKTTESNPKYELWLKAQAEYVDSCVEKDKKLNSQKYRTTTDSGAPYWDIYPQQKSEDCSKEYSTKFPTNLDPTIIKTKTCSTAEYVKCIAFFNICVLDIDGAK